MATVTTTQLGNGAGPYATDIVVKDLDMTVSNYVKDRTPMTNIAMSKKRKINSTLHIWPVDTYRLATLNAKSEGASVSAGDADSNSRANMGNYAQIFTTTIGATGTARAVEQAGGDPQAYQEVKQLTEIMFDVELQLVRTDAASVKFDGTGASGQSAPNQGRRFGSVIAFAGTVSQNPATTPTLNLVPESGGTATTSNTGVPFNGSLANAGEGWWSTGGTAQQFDPFLYKQLVTVAETRFNAKLTNVMCATSRRTALSTQFPQSRSINRFNPADKGDVVSTYEGDFNYTYQIDDNYHMDTTGSESSGILFFNPDVIQWGSLRELGPNNEVFSNADASLDQYIMEGTLIVRNPAGVGWFRDISTAVNGAAITTARTYCLRYT